MTPETFAQIFHQQILLSEDIMMAKRKEYGAEVDCLANFRTAAALQNETVPEALAGQMAKQTVSIYEMIRSGKEYPLEFWFEKITDHINYLILLRAIITEGYLDNLPEWVEYASKEPTNA